jgi:hypothetical protein
MELLAAIGGGSFVLVSLVIGVRVMWLARRTRGLPEFAMALGLLLMGGLGYPILILAQFGSFLPDGARVWFLYAQIGVVVFLWSAIESLRYFARLRKRQKIGLADAVVANRFLLWGVGTLCAASVTTITQILQTMGIDTNGTPAGAAAIAPLGLIASGTLWLAFLPPARYSRWVTARAARQG